MNAQYFIFLSSSRQALKTKLHRPSFQKSVIIVQNLLLPYLIYVNQILLFPEHLCNVPPYVFLLLERVREEVNDN